MMFNDLKPIFPGEHFRPYDRTYSHWLSYFDYLSFVGADKTTL